MKEKIVNKMIDFYRGNRSDVRHFLKVYAYAQTIGRLEGLDERTQDTLEIAAIVHDIACPLCREKYGNTNGNHQEAESEDLLRTFLLEFALPEEMQERIEYVPETTLSDFVSRINDLRDEKVMKRLTIKSLTEMLLERGCLEKKYQNGYTRKILTKKGREAGIRAEEQLSSKGNTYEIFLYTERAQHFLVDLIKEMKL